MTEISPVLPPSHRTDVALPTHQFEKWPEEGTKVICLVQKAKGEAYKIYSGTVAKHKTRNKLCVLCNDEKYRFPNLSNVFVEGSNTKRIMTRVHTQVI